MLKPSLPGPIGPEEETIGALLASLEAGPILAGLNAKIIEPDGDRRNLDRFGVEAEDLPAIRMTNEPSFQTKWIDEVAHGGRLVVKLELWIPGTHWRDRRRFVAALRRDLGIGRRSDGRSFYDVLQMNGAPATLRGATMIEGGGRIATKGDDDYAQVVEVMFGFDIDLID